MCEDYCSYEVSKLLKEKGFDEKTRAYFYGDGLSLQNIPRNYNSSIIKRPKEITACPTHQMAMKWLREKGIYIEINPTFKEEPMSYWYAVTTKNHYHDESYYDTYEQAVEAALKYCLTNLV